MSDWYGVDSGDIMRSVEADTYIDAAVKATVEHIQEHGGATPGAIYCVVKVGEDEDDEMVMLSDVVQSAGGFVVELDPPNEGDPKI